MAFDSFSAFVAMEGHGPYVWACYAVFFVLMLWMMIGSVRSRNTIIDACRRGYEFQADKSKVEASSPPSASFARVNVSQD
ncbi:heme exporter protein CcmD [Marinobacter sp.]|uniref:heme exporter protein CcmD n=1 Tax=Marinobacter sp. TaxID=50741 RepID=UPI003A92DB9D